MNDIDWGKEARKELAKENSRLRGEVKQYKKALRNLAKRHREVAPWDEVSAITYAEYLLEDD